MTRFEHMLETFRGKPGPEIEEKLNALAGDGWRVVSAYATPDGTSTIWQHHYVMVRSLGDDGEPVIGDTAVRITVAPGPDLIRVVDEAKAAIAKSKGRGR